MAWGQQTFMWAKSFWGLKLYGKLWEFEPDLPSLSLEGVFKGCK